MGKMHVCRRLMIEELEPRVALATTVFLTNGLPQADPDFFGVYVGPGGGARGSLFQGMGTIYDYFAFVDVGGTVTNLYNVGTDPVLQGNKVVSDATVTVTSGTISVHVESEVASGATVMVNTYSFSTTGTADLQNARLFQYLDSDIGNLSDNVLTVFGTVAANNLMLVTQDPSTLIKLGQLLGQPQVGASVAGFAADKFPDLRTAITNGGYNPPASGDIDTTALPPGNFPGIGAGYGPGDITTAIDYNFTSSTSATVRTTLGMTTEESFTMKRKIPLPARFEDDDGTRVTVALSGPGKGYITLMNGGLTWSQMDTIAMRNTNQGSSLVIRTIGGSVPGTTFKTLTIDSANGATAALKTLNASTTDMVSSGRIDADAGIRSIVLRDIGGLSTINVPGALGSFVARTIGAQFNMNVENAMGRFAAATLGSNSNILVGSTGNFGIGNFSVLNGMDHVVVQTSGNINHVLIYKYCIASSIAANIGPGPDGKYGTADDVVLNPNNLGNIESLHVQTSLMGTPSPSDNFGLVAHGRIGSLVIRATHFRLPFQIDNVIVQSYWK